MCVWDAPFAVFPFWASPQLFLGADVPAGFAVAGRCFPSGEAATACGLGFGAVAVLGLLGATAVSLEAAVQAFTVAIATPPTGTLPRLGRKEPATATVPLGFA